MHGRVQLGLAIALLMLGAMGLSACGVRGPLEVPKEAAEANETGNATPGTPGKPVAHKPSILDPLLR
jgi:predicted small lipoprotein YifL